MSFIRKTVSVAGFFSLAMSTAFAQGLPQSVVDCSAQKYDAARLACFDREVARLTRPSETVASTQVPLAQSVPPTPAVAVVQQENTKSKVDDFGVSGELARKRKEAENEVDAPLETLQAAVTRVTTKAYGELVFELDNGQVWEQPEKKYALSIKAGQKVRITQGAMGSYFLAAESGATTRVRRVR